MGTVIFFAIIVLVFTFAVWLIHKGAAGAYSIFHDTVDLNKVF
ncbi:hypothetical protein [Heyndrickxia ginsengihumi]|nr:hypothetical protein [Heyndrickxia ginsengihumi]